MQKYTYFYTRLFNYGLGDVIETKALIHNIDTNEYYYAQRSSKEDKEMLNISCLKDLEGFLDISAIVPGELDVEQIKTIKNMLEKEKFQEKCSSLNLKHKERYAEYFELYHRLNGYVNIDLNSILLTLDTFEDFHKSPYSFSYYDSENISWENKPEKSLRLSNHWNIKNDASDSLHCPLKGTNLRMDNTWLLCQFNKNKYEILDFFGGENSELIRKLQGRQEIM